MAAPTYVQNNNHCVSGVCVDDTAKTAPLAESRKANPDSNNSPLNSSLSWNNDRYKLDGIDGFITLNDCSYRLDGIDEIDDGYNQELPKQSPPNQFTETIRAQKHIAVCPASIMFPFQEYEDSYAITRHKRRQQYICT